MEFPSAEKYKAFPVDAQREILEGFRREQMARHEWLKSQQANDHEINIVAQKNFYRWRLISAAFGGGLAILTISLGAWLVSKGASGTGVSMMVTAAAVLIGSAVYGHKVARSEPETEDQALTSPK